MSTEVNPLHRPDWFNRDLFFTAVMQSISFATPLIEVFTIRAIVDSQSIVPGMPYPEDIRIFIADEASHARAHVALNQELLLKYASPPQGYQGFKKRMQFLNHALSGAQRVRIAADMERWTALWSAWYLSQHDQLSIASISAKKLYAWHAQAEVSHAHVLIALAAQEPLPSAWRHWLFLSAYRLSILIYFSRSVTWFVYYDNQKSILKSARCLLKTAYKVTRSMETYRLLISCLRTSEH